MSRRVMNGLALRTNRGWGEKKKREGVGGGRGRKEMGSE